MTKMIKDNWSDDKLEVAEWLAETRVKSIERQVAPIGNGDRTVDRENRLLETLYSLWQEGALANYEHSHAIIKVVNNARQCGDGLSWGEYRFVYWIVMENLWEVILDRKRNLEAIERRKKLGESRKEVNLTNSNWGLF